MRRWEIGVAASVMVAVLATASSAYATTDSIDQSQPGHSSQVDDGVFGGDMEGQTFVAGRSGNLDRVALYVQGNGTDVLDVSIETVGPETYLGTTIQAPTGTSLASTSIVPPASAGWVEVDFPTPAAVTGGKPYAIVLSTGNGYFQTYGEYGTSAYPQGEELHWSGGWYQSASAELAFATYLEETPTALSANDVTVTQSALGGAATFSATLTANGTGVPGETVTFSMSSQGGTVSCSGQTDANGVATCSLPLTQSGPTLLFASSYSATFAGGGGYLPSSASASVSLS